MSAGKSAFTKKGGTAGSTPVVRSEGGAKSLPQEVSSKNRRTKLINANSTSRPVSDVSEPNAL